jgi:hypothetical protein
LEDGLLKSKSFSTKRLIEPSTHLEIRMQNDFRLRQSYGVTGYALGPQTIRFEYTL